MNTVHSEKHNANTRWGKFRHTLWRRFKYEYGDRVVQPWWLWVREFLSGNIKETPLIILKKKFKWTDDLKSSKYRLHAASGDCHFFPCCAFYACSSSPLARGSSIKLASHKHSSYKVASNAVWRMVLEWLHHSHGLLSHLGLGQGTPLILFCLWNLSKHSRYHYKWTRNVSWELFKPPKLLFTGGFLSLYFLQTAGSVLTRSMLKKFILLIN